MKIEALELRAFGPFTNRALDLSSGTLGFHLVYGENEAGKSSALEAIGNLLFGIDRSSAYGFVHSYKDLRLGGVLSMSSGEKLAFVRRKGSKATLRTYDDTQVIEDAVLARYLTDVDEGLFASLFGIDHERLRQGGDEILRGSGRVGELLFAAAGVADLHDYERQLQAECESLFSPSSRAQRPLINSGIRQLRGALEELKHSQLSVDVWRAQQESRRQAEDRRKELDDRLRHLRAEQRRWTRIQQALPIIAKWNATCEELLAVGAVVLLPEDFGQRREDAVANLKRAQAQKQDLERLCRKVESQLESIVLPVELLAAGPEVEDLQQQLGSYRKAMQDRPGLIRDRSAVEDQIHRVLQKLGRPADLSQVDEWQIPTDQRVRIQELATQHEGLAERRRSVEQKLEDLQHSVADAGSRLTSLGEPVDVSELRVKVAQIQQAGDLQEQRDALQRDLERLEADTAVRLDQLGLWSGSIEDCERLSVPLDATVDQFETAFQTLRQELAGCAAELAELENQQKELRSHLHELEQGRAIPTEEELLQLRRQRDEGWKYIALLLQGEATEPAGMEEWLRNFSRDGTIVDAYARLVVSADEFVDRMRGDAHRVAEKKLLQSRQADVEQRHQRINERRQKIAQESAACEDEWLQHWQPAGIKPLGPREMRAWLRRHATMAEASIEIRRLKGECDRLQQQIAAAGHDLRRGMAALGVSLSDDARSLSELLELARCHLDALQEQKSERRQLMAQQQDQLNALERARQESASLQHEWEQWRRAWEAAMQLLGLEGCATPAQAGSVLEHLGDLSRGLHDAEQLRLRIEGIDADAQRFESHVKDVVSRLAPDLIAQPIADAIQELAQRLGLARSAGQEHASLTAQREQHLARLDDVDAALSSAQAELRALCDLAECDDPADLRSAEQASRRRRDLEETQHDQREVLYSLSGGMGLDDFLAEARQEDPDELEARLMQCEQDIRDVEARRDEVLKEIEQIRFQLEVREKSQPAATHAEDCEFLKCQLADQIRELAVLRVAGGVLRLGIDRYRERNQGPVLERAGQVFRQLTLGAFEELKVDFNQSGDPELFGVRSGENKLVAVSGMSDGTRDQLYLALRVASIENWLRHHEPMPLIVDDILVNFDDRRAAAALQVLAELSRQTQVICFTHHARLVDLAEQSLSKDILFTHTLSTDGS